MNSPHGNLRRKSVAPTTITTISSSTGYTAVYTVWGDTAADVSGSFVAEYGA